MGRMRLRCAAISHTTMSEPSRSDMFQTTSNWHLYELNAQAKAVATSSWRSQGGSATVAGLVIRATSVRTCRTGQSGTRTTVRTVASWLHPSGCAGEVATFWLASDALSKTSFWHMPALLRHSTNGSRSHPRFSCHCSQGRTRAADSTSSPKVTKCFDRNCLFRSFLQVAWVLLPIRLCASTRDTKIIQLPKLLWRLSPASALSWWVHKHLGFNMLQITQDSYRSGNKDSQRR